MIHWKCKPFSSLDANELYNILMLRNEVFIVEQACAYQDLDGKDEGAHHLMGWEDGALVAYTRLLPPGLAYSEASIGRVVTSPRQRGRGLGKELMRRSIDKCRELFDDAPLRIGAQHYLLKFYSAFGFRPEGDIYLEDGIPHISMIK